MLACHTAVGMATCYPASSISESALMLRDIIWQLCDFDGLDSEKTMLLSPYVDAIQEEPSLTNEAFMTALERHGWNRQSHCFDGPVNFKKLCRDLPVIWPDQGAHDGQISEKTDVSRSPRKLRQILDEIDSLITNT